MAWTCLTNIAIPRVPHVTRRALAGSAPDGAPRPLSRSRRPKSIVCVAFWWSVCGVSPRCRRDRLLPAQPVEPWLLQRSRMRWRSQRSASVTSEFGKSPNRVTHGDTARLTPALGSCDSGRLAIYGSAARGRSTKGESHDQVLNRSTGPPLIRPVWAGPGWARVKPSRRCLAASVVQREVLASHRSRRGPSKFAWRE